MNITFKDYATKNTICTELKKGELIEFDGYIWQVQKVGKTMCRLTPHGHNKLPMWIHYERLFNF